MGVPASSIKVSISGGADYYFDLAPVPENHVITATALGDDGPFDFSMNDWSAGMLTAYDGYEYEAGAPPMYLSAKGVDAQFSHQLILQPAVTTVTLAAAANALSAPVKQVDFGTNTYLMESGRYVHGLNVSNQWQDYADLGAGNSSSDGVNQGGYLAVAATGFYSYTQTAASYNAWTNASTAADRFGTLRDQLWRAVRPNSIFSATNIASAWSSSSTVADSGFNINSLSGLEQLLLIGKEDGIYSIDFEGLVVPFTPELRSQYSSKFASVSGVAVFNGNYYFRTLNGIIEINGADGTKHKVGLDQLASPDMPTPRVKALTADDRFLYAICENTSSGLMILRRNIQGVWHPYYWDPNAGAANHIAVSGGLGYPALFFSYGTPPVTKYIRLSTYANPIDDANYTFDTTQSGWIRFPRFGSAVEKTMVDRIALITQNCTANITVTVYASVDGGAVTQVVGTNNPITTSPSSPILVTTPLIGNFFDFYLYLATNSTATTPIVRAFHASGIRRPMTRKAHNYLVIADTWHAENRAGQVLESPVTTGLNLQTLRQSSTIQILTDENQQTYNGYVTGLGSELKDVVLPNREPSRVLRIQFTEQVSA